MIRLTALRNFTYPPWPYLFGLSALGFLALSFAANKISIPAICGGGSQAMLQGQSPIDAIRTVLLFNGPFGLFAMWALMLVAMMPTLLGAPLHFVWRACLSDRRFISICGFVAGYATVWLLVGPVFFAAAILDQSLFGSLAPLIGIFMALFWGSTPLHRIALNRAHRYPNLRIFGWRAVTDCLQYGVTHAALCVVSCWAWMLVPMLAVNNHYELMFVSGLIMLVERLTPPSRPRWRVPIPVSFAGRLAQWSMIRGRNRFA